MAQPWKCCANCQCPCKNNDICADTAAHIISHANGNTSQSDGQSEQSERSSRNGSEGPTLQDLYNLEQRIEQRLKDLSKPSDQPLRDALSQTSDSTHLSSNGSNGQTDRELYLNEIHILRLRLQEAELRSAITEERVEQMASLHKQTTITTEEIEETRRQIIEFIDRKFAQLTHNRN